jgi:UPF0755 protein
MTDPAPEGTPDGTSEGRPAGPYDGPDDGPDEGPDDGPENDRVLEEQFRAQAGGRRRSAAPAGRLRGCLPVLLVLAVVLGLVYLGATRGVDFIQDQFADPEDYAGPGSGEVTFEVVSGDSVAEMGRNLKKQHVVASVEAFTDAASSNSCATSIQVGFYSLKREMKAADALGVLCDPKQQLSTAVVIPEGLRAVDILDILVAETDFSRGRFEKALRDTEALGLPSYAEVNLDGFPEGYLFPATYGFGPKETPESMLKAMVDRWKQAAADADLEAAAAELGYTPHELMTIASLVEAEGRGGDMPKVARVIYNRLENPGTAGTIGRLQIDATVAYALGEKLGVQLTEEQLAVDSPYNTRIKDGLPPGPIDSPGDAAIKAATHPAKGDWYYYVTVNLRTGETKFAETPEEFAQYKAEFLEYCETSDAC